MACHRLMINRNADHTLMTSKQRGMIGHRPYMAIHDEIVAETWSLEARTKHLHADQAVLADLKARCAESGHHPKARVYLKASEMTQLRRLAGQTTTTLCKKNKRRHVIFIAGLIGQAELHLEQRAIELITEKLAPPKHVAFQDTGWPNLQQIPKQNSFYQQIAKYLK